MDSFEFDSVKIEKANAMRRYYRLRNFAKLVHLMEFIVALVLLSWSSNWLPAAVEISAGYLRELSGVILSTPFVFIVGNAIIFTLFLQSGRINGSSRVEMDAAGSDLHENFDPGFESPAPKEAYHHQEQIVCTEKSAFATPERRIEKEENSAEVTDSNEEYTEVAEKVSEFTEEAAELKHYRRSESESFECNFYDKKPRELRRSVTDEIQNQKSSGNDAAILPSSDVDELSSEEFRRTVEAFISRQQRILREENRAIVLLQRSSSVRVQ